MSEKNVTLCKYTGCGAEEERGGGAGIEMSLHHHMRFILAGRENLAHRKETKQWLTKGMHFPEKAVDGRFYHFCSRTKKRENPWWHVKLEGTAHITDVALQNRKDCCGKYTERSRAPRGVI